MLSILSSVRALHWEGFRLQWLLCCCSCLSSLLTSDLNSSASWAGNLEDVCYLAAMSGFNGGVFWGDGKVGTFL